MKKVMLVTPTLAMGGAEIMCENLAYALRDLGIDISVISLYNKETLIPEDSSLLEIIVSLLYRLITDISIPRSRHGWS